jgi:hypothetical protein
MMRTPVFGKVAPSEAHLDRIYRSDHGLLNASNQSDTAFVLRVVWRVLILVAFVLLTFPPCFAAMGGGLDSSWVIGINEAALRHMVFGRDVVFTFGPLGFIITPRNLGSNMVHAIMFRVGLHLFWWISVGLLLFRIRGYVASFLFAAAFGLSGIYFGPSWDVNFQLTGVFNLTAMAYLVLGHIDRRPIWGVPAAIVAATALLAKFNIGVACAGAMVVWTVIQLRREPSPRMFWRLCLVAVTYVGVLAGLFRIYGGPMSALGDFLKYSSQLASGYSSQMSWPGPEAVVKVAAGTMVIALIAAAAGILRRASYTPVLLIILFPLFVLYKSATVRLDDGHYMTSCPVPIGLFALLLPGHLGRWRSWITQAILATGLLAMSWFTPSSVQSLFSRGAQSWVSVCKYAETMANIKVLDARGRGKIQLPTSFLSKIGSAPMDVYPWDIAYAWANGLNWKPRFVFQSYCAYIPILDFKSAQNYREENAPKYIIFSYQAIDNEHPCIVDPHTLMEIYRWYDVVDQANGLLLLKRGTNPRWNWDEMEKLGTKTVAFGERWNVPESGAGPIILKAKLKLSPLGRLVCMLYKVYPPTICLQYRDGSTSKHRLVWQNVESGFLVSSLPRDLNGVRQFLEQGEADPVRAISFRNGGWWFEKECQLSWSRVSMNPGARHGEVSGPIAAISSSSMAQE